VPSLKCEKSYLTYWILGFFGVLAILLLLWWGLNSYLDSRKGKAQRRKKANDRLSFAGALSRGVTTADGGRASLNMDLVDRIQGLSQFGLGA
jgi:uncharacterized membrane-anchored protein